MYHHVSKHENIAMELSNEWSLTPSNEGVYDILNKYIPILYDELMLHLKHFQTIKEFKLNFDQRRFLPTLEKLKFTMITTPAFKPMGLKGKYIDYAVKLNDSADKSSRIPTILSAYRNYISRLLNHPSEWMSVNQKITQDLKSLNDEKERDIEQIAKFFDNSHNTEDRVDKLVSNKEEFVKLFGVINYSNGVITSIKLSDVKEEITRTVNELRLIRKVISSRNLPEDSKAQAEDLGNNTLIVAGLLEYMVLVYHKQQELNAAITDTMVAIVNDYEKK